MRQANGRHPAARLRSLGHAALVISLAAQLASGTVAEAAEASGTALQWVRLPGSEDCLSGGALAERVEAKLGRALSPASGRASQLVEGHVERTPDGYRAELRMSGSEGKPLGSRELGSQQASCAELSEMLVVVLAVMIDPEGAARSEPPPKSTRPTGPKEEPRPTPMPQVEPPRQRLTGFARLAVGLLPEMALGIGAAYELALPRWGGLRVEGVGYLPEEQQLPGSPELSARLRIAHAGLAYCPLWLEGARARLAGCVGGELGGAYSRGVGFDTGNKSTVAVWGSGSASVRLAMRLMSALELQAGASFVVPAARGYEAINELGQPKPLFEQSPVAGTFDLGLGARF